MKDWRVTLYIWAIENDLIAVPKKVGRPLKAPHKLLNYKLELE